MQHRDETDLSEAWLDVDELRELVRAEVRATLADSPEAVIASGAARRADDDAAELAATRAEVGQLRAQRDPPQTWRHRMWGCRAGESW